MNFEEHAAKPLLAEAGIRIPRGRLCTTPAEAATAAEALGKAVVKAQVPAGKRGKAGGIARVDGADEAREAARRILGMEIGGYRVERVLVEERMELRRELYLAILNDPGTKGPLILYSPEGGMEIEELAESRPDRLLRLPVDIREGIDGPALRAGIERLGGGAATEAVCGLVDRLYALYAGTDAELIEINPLALTDDGPVALDCKLVLDDSGAARRPELAGKGAPPRLTALEAEAAALGLNYIQLDGEVGILANGAGLTMATMDAVAHFGGRPANFLEIGGEAYTLSRPALELVLKNPRVRSLLVNFCGAFARTEVMTAGIVEAWGQVRPTVPVFFSVSGTGEDEAIAMVRDKLGLEPAATMDEAVRNAVEAAR